MTLLPLAVVAPAVAAVAAVALGAGTAAAGQADEYDRVRYVVCADGPGPHQVGYDDAYGSHEVVLETLPENIGGDRNCGSVNFTATEDYTFTHVSIDTAAPYAYCAIYINGEVSEMSNDIDTHGYGTYASCY